MDLIVKLRHMGRQYAQGQHARGGGQQKHYLEEAADEIEILRTLVGDIKAWDVANYMALPYNLRVRIQAILIVPNVELSRNQRREESHEKK